LRENQLKLSYTQVITFTYCALILFGAVLLCLPAASRSGEWTPPLDALFTATSAACVTGLVLYDTYAHWSVFGQMTIFFLFQIGGIGFMTVITMFSIFLKRKIGLYERQVLVQSTGILRLGGVLRLIKNIVLLSLCVELTGAVLLALRFCPLMGVKSGVYNAVFHSVSAFCNSGFELMGKYGQFSLLNGFVKDYTVSLTLVFLVVMGGIGFVVLDDIRMHKFRAEKYSLHTKITLTVTGLLILSGFILFNIFESGGLLAEFTVKEKIIVSLFHSVNSRTSGFNAIDISGLKETSVILAMAFMFIGGSSGSTAGGIKTSTLAILVMSMINSTKKVNKMMIFKRKLSDKTVKYASSIVMIYLFAVVTASIIICYVEPVSLREAFFESVSALGTAGLSLGITPSLGSTAKTALIVLMFSGRLGWITLLLAFAKKHIDLPFERPGEKILIG
jgi:trk system potassium uptake protein TrkH